MRNIHWSSITKIGVFVLMAIVALTAQSSPGDVRLGESEYKAKAEELFSLPLTVDVGSIPLGAFDLNFTYDPGVVSLEGIIGTAAEFSISLAHSAVPSANGNVSPNISPEKKNGTL